MMTHRVTVRRVVPCLIAGAIAASSGAGTPPPVELRVVTYNLKNGVGAPGTADFLTTGDFLTILDVDGAGPNTGLKPDVVCLQECDQSRSSDITAFRDAYLPGYSLRSASGDGFNFNVTLARPDITIVSSSGINVGGPRQVVKTRMRVPGALRDVIIYNAHFKSGSDSSSQNQRRSNANSSGDNVFFELQNSGVNVIFTGDLNSNSNQDGTITDLFFETSQTPTVSTGILNLPVESLAGAANQGATVLTTFPSSGSRLDYVCLDVELADFFDADNSGGFSQAEFNSMGFVYYSQDDAGLRSNGNSGATSSPSDHRPVVFDVRLPRDPNAAYFEPADANQDSSVNIEDLYLWENRFALTIPPTPSTAADIDGDRNVDLDDRRALRNTLRGGEIADIAIVP